MENCLHHKRFWISIKDGKAIVDIEEFKHVKVQRLKAGDEFIGIDGSGFEFLCKINDIENRIINATIEYKRSCKLEPEIEMILCQAELKGLGLSTAIDFSIQAGIAKFIYFPTERSQGKSISIGRIKRKMLSSVKQSGRAKVIFVDRYDSIVSMLKILDSYKISLKLLLVLDNDSEFLHNILLKEKGSPSGVVIAVGPEGDFTENEIDIFIKNRFIKVKLGDIRIRSYLAGAFASNIVFNYFGKDIKRREERWRTVSSVK